MAIDAENDGLVTIVSEIICQLCRARSHLATLTNISVAKSLSESYLSRSEVQRRAEKVKHFYLATVERKKE